MNKPGENGAVLVSKGLSDSPYTERYELMKEIKSKRATGHTFSGYVKDITGYGDGDRYLHIAQYSGSDTKQLPEVLGPQSTLLSGDTIIEISKRNANGTLPESPEKADKLQPSLTINHKGVTQTIALESDIPGEDWYKILKEHYSHIHNILQPLTDVGMNDKERVKNIVLRYLQDNNIIKIPLGKSLTPIQKLKKRLWDLLGRSKSNDTSEVQKAA